MFRWAAVLGQEFGVADLEVVTGRDASDLIEVVQDRPATSLAHVARLKALHAMTLTGLDRLEEGVQEARAALASAEAIGDKLAAGYALQTLMWPIYHAHDFAAMVDHIDEALDVIGDDPAATDLHLLLLMNRFAMLDTLDRRAEALATAQQALALGERAGTPAAAWHPPRRPPQPWSGLRLGGTDPDRGQDRRPGRQGPVQP